MKQKKLAYFFVIPMCIILFIFLILPISTNFAISLFDINNNPKNWFDSTPSFYNYILALRQDGFINAVKNSIIYTMVTTICSTTIGLFMALCISNPFKGRSIAISLIMISWALPSFVVGLFFGTLFQMEMLNPQWIVGENAIFAVAVPAIWHYFPYSMLLFLVGLNSVKSDVNDAAIMDGAKNWEKFFYITLPILKPVFIAVFVQNFIINIYSFNIIVMMFGGGTIIPGKGADMLMPYIFRTAFQYWNLGVGAALSMMLMTVVGVAILFYYRRLKIDNYGV
ncbi:hypothetical protein AGMMS49938_06410 [Fibrobacterales bacterium]|nr:hypothetical protein AGMMS49938_06410 [Fibrobacterales bacterium]